MSSVANEKTTEDTKIKEHWYANGQLSVRKNVLVSNGYTHGLTERWYESGQMQERYSCMSGKMHGIFEHWTKSGVLCHKTNYIDHKPHGQCLGEFWSTLEDVAEPGNSDDYKVTYYHHGVKLSEDEYRARLALLSFVVAKSVDPFGADGTVWNQLGELVADYADLAVDSASVAAALADIPEPY